MTSVIPCGQTITNNTTTTALTPNISCIWVNYFNVLVHETGGKCIAIYATSDDDTIIVMHGTVCWAPAFKRTLKTVSDVLVPSHKIQGWRPEISEPRPGVLKQFAWPTETGLTQASNSVVLVAHSSMSSHMPT